MGKGGICEDNLPRSCDLRSTFAYVVRYKPTPTAMMWRLISIADNIFLLRLKRLAPQFVYFVSTSLLLCPIGIVGAAVSLFPGHLLAVVLFRKKQLRDL